MGYLAKPKGVGARPAVLVIHENRGLSPHFEDVSRRLAKAGYVALAIDLLSREGGTSAIEPGAASTTMGCASDVRLSEDMNGGLKYLQGL